MPVDRHCYGYRQHLFPLLLATLIFSLLSACTPRQDPAISAENILTVVIRPGYTTYFEGSDGPGGFEYELASRFAQSLGKQLKVIPAYNLEELFATLERGEADVAASGLTVTPRLEQRFLASIPYMEAEALVLYRYGGVRPRSVDDLIGLNVLVTANSSHVERLQELQQTLPDLAWQESSELDTVDMLQDLDSGSVDAIVLNSNEFDANKSLFVDIGKAFSITKAEPMAWYTRKNDAGQTLQTAANDFFAALEADGVVTEIQERLYGHNTHTKRMGSRIFYQRVQDRLPGYATLIKKVAKEENMDWRLLAAISYQESHWIPTATSPTGVRGMMMLTHAAADEVGVDDRVDTEQSLRGGARYFLMTRDRMPRDIKEPDRTWLALAAYNVGLGHLEDARKITERQGGNPDKWLDVMQRLPLLRDPAYFKETRHGYARGNESVAFVQRIRHFFNILAYDELMSSRRRPPIDVALYTPEKLRSPASLVAL